MHVVEPLLLCVILSVLFRRLGVWNRTLISLKTLTQHTWNKKIKINYTFASFPLPFAWEAFHLNLLFLIYLKEYPS